MMTRDAEYRVTLGRSEDLIAKAERLRGAVFRAHASRPDRDPWDEKSTHVLIEDAEGRACATFRIALHQDSSSLRESYTGRFYDLSAFDDVLGPFLEIGRLSTLPEHDDPNIIRHIWAEIANLVIENTVTMLFGCSSFPVEDAKEISEALALLGENFSAPQTLRAKALGEVFWSLETFKKPEIDHARALRQLPSVLRSYLRLGARVSDSVVYDPELSTLVILTTLETAKIPQTRRKTLIKDLRYLRSR